MSEKKTVLIIDDEPDLLDLLCMTVEEEEIETLRAANGEEGIAVFEEHRPTLVITDQNMPKKSGEEVLQAIKALAPETKVIIMSGGEDLPGFDEGIKKPIDFDQFAALVKRLA